MVLDPDGNGGDGATLATYACKFHDGRGPGDLPDLTNHIAEANAAMGDAGLDAGFQIVPLTSDVDGPDVVLVAGAASTAVALGTDRGRRRLTLV